MLEAGEDGLGIEILDGDANIEKGPRRNSSFVYDRKERVSDRKYLD